MKKIMELLQNMKAKNEKKDNKGFSLVELIIVIAIMAILVGIVGTQVLPYINKSKEAKDFQIINSYGTAATTAYWKGYRFNIIDTLQLLLLWMQILQHRIQMQLVRQQKLLQLKFNL